MNVAILTRHPAGNDEWVLWHAPIEVLIARQLDEVKGVIDRVEAETIKGHYAVGFVSYEAGAALDPSFAIRREQTGLPLAWFAIFKGFLPYHFTTSFPSPCHWTPDIAPDDYCKNIDRIRECIASGETYQVNYTFMLRADRNPLMKSLFYRLYRSQPTPYAMYIETPEFRVASVSPETFFRLDGNTIVCEPMKGTVHRAPHPALDDDAGKFLAASTKNRAENLMIVDMVRNDLGRIAQSGSVNVDQLFNTTRWPTLWQMTSTISASSNASLLDIFTALFPSASITGAPKLQTSKIIAGLERSPRGLYTGAIGWAGPQRRACFAVAIRTVVQTTVPDQTVYGIGSGIVWDSVAGEEYEECQLKARILEEPVAPSFRLLETMRWDPGQGYFLLDGHLNRMETSAAFFQFPFDRDKTLSTLHADAASWSGESRRVRVLIDHAGNVQLESASIDQNFCDGPDLAVTMTASLDGERQDISSPLWYHKTTQRKFYDQARERYPGCDDVLLVNRNDHVMEFTNGNIVMKFGDEYITPPLSSGLLPGVYREHLIASRKVIEREIPILDLYSADAVYFINSVRGWRRIQFVH